MGKLVVKGVLGFDEEDGSEIKEEAKTGKGKRRVNFDEARRMYVEERFGREGIAADGRPLDRKAVMFDR